MCEIIRRDRFIIEAGHHNRDSVIIVLEGRFACTVFGRTWTVDAGDIVAFRRETWFTRKVLSPLRCVYIQFEQFPEPMETGPLLTEDPERTRNTVMHLARAVEEGNRELEQHFLRDILLLHRYGRENRVSRDETVSACVAYFQEHYRERITLDGLSSHFFISKQGLMRKFRKTLGKSPMEYLAMVRLNRSKQLLADTALSVGQIAGLCGYENVYYFSNCFKRLAGVSPTEYRRLMSL